MLQHLVIPLVALSSVFSWAEPSAVPVEYDLFAIGKSWQWLYSEKNGTSFKPYYIERYEVIDITPDRHITIEMSSSPAGQPNHLAHHRFVIDFKKCERASKNPAAKNFSLTFYRKIQSGEWSLVSRNHSSLAFTEKFNCAKKFPNQKIHQKSVYFQNEEFRGFQFDSPQSQFESWYFSDHPQLKGVAAEKHFAPEGGYKFELID